MKGENGPAPKRKAGRIASRAGSEHSRQAIASKKSALCGYGCGTPRRLAGFRSCRRR